MSTAPPTSPHRRPVRRQQGRLLAALAAAVTVASTLAGCTAGPAGPPSAAPTSTPPAAQQAEIAAVADAAMAKYRLKALIVRVTIGGTNIYTKASGDSMAGVPATADMQVRNGFVAYTYLTTMLLEFADRHKLSLDDPVSKYLPNLPEAHQVTLKMLANSTSGYADYVYQPAVLNGVEADPFRQWSAAELIKVGTSAPPMFAPGTNWAYSHTNYAILGEVLAKAGGKPLGQLMEQYIFKPMGLKHTRASNTPQIPPPVLHTFSSERRAQLGIAPGIPFYEDSTYWNPSWTAPSGAIQTTDIADLTASIRAIGTGKLLSPASHRAQVGANLVGFGHPQAGCPACQQNTAAHSFGMAAILQGPWITGNKFYAGSGAAVAYLPSQKIAIAVITTYQPDAFDGDSNVTDAGPAILSALADTLAPDSPMPH